MSGTSTSLGSIQSPVEPLWRGQGIGPDDSSDRQDREIRAFESAIEHLLSALEAQQGGSGGGASTAGTMPVDAMHTGAPSTGTTPAVTASSNLVPGGEPSSDAAGTSTATASNGSSGGQVVNIDGGNVDGVGVTEKVDNNTGAAAKFGWENSSGQLVGVLNLQNGQSGAFDINAAGSDGKSARLIKLNPDGTIPQQSNLDEQNVTLNPNGAIQNSPDVSEITAGSDPTKITITDGGGKTVGNGAPGGAYWYPTQDQQTDPADNPMTMAMDTSNVYDNDFTN